MSQRFFAKKNAICFIQKNSFKTSVEDQDFSIPNPGSGTAALIDKEFKQFF